MGSNVVYNATAQNWVREGLVADPRNAEWRESDLKSGCPSNLSQADELFLMLSLGLKVYDLPNVLKCHNHQFHGYFTVTSVEV